MQTELLTPALSNYMCLRGEKIQLSPPCKHPQTQLTLPATKAVWMFVGSVHITGIWDKSTLRCLHLTCIGPHLEYASQSWDPYTSQGIRSLESIQKLACKVCLKQWDLDYNSMLQLLDIPPLSTCSPSGELQISHPNKFPGFDTYLLDVVFPG